MTSTLYTHDSASRLKTVGDGTNTATYSYLANSPLVEQIAFDESGNPRMTTSKAYDYANRLTSISHADSQPSTLAAFNYQYNSANQRIKVTREDGSYWDYAYDALGQVSSGKKRNASAQLFPGLQYEYDYDDIGNRTQTRSGGDATGGNLRAADYSANALNQYESRDLPSFVEAQGEADANAVVTVNGQGTERVGRYYRKELFADNAAGPVVVGITNTAVLPGAGPGGEDLVKEETGSQTLGRTPETFTYDADGNLTADSLWNYVWNGENRLVELTSNTNLPAANRKRLLFTYDHQGRRIRKEVQTWDQATSSYLPSSTNSFVYDRWNLIAELDSSSTVLRSYTWGLDLSGSEQGAGGVGGLLFLTQHPNSQPSTHCVGHDGNGNVTLLADSTTGVVTAEYEYSPFGKVVRATGIIASATPFGFSTKYRDKETGFSYYGFRSYDCENSRWLRRDPLGERGGINLYAILENNCIDRLDALGLADPAQDYTPPLGEYDEDGWPIDPETGLPKIPKSLYTCAGIDRDGNPIPPMKALSLHCGLPGGCFPTISRTAKLPKHGPTCRAFYKPFGTLIKQPLTNPRVCVYKYNYHTGGGVHSSWLIQFVLPPGRLKCPSQFLLVCHMHRKPIKPPVSTGIRG